ncbi:hypothetical protein [Qipengyuania aestuarii]|nr:hypothetical protein [Qipengyuania aestuarii]
MKNISHEFEVEDIQLEEVEVRELELREEAGIDLFPGDGVICRTT